MENRQLRILLLLLTIIAFSACKKQKDGTATNDKAPHQKNKVLVGLEISSIKVLSVPRYGKDGEEWDSWAPMAEQPDVFVRISQTTTELYVSEVKENFTFDTPFQMFNDLPLTVKAYTDNLLVEVFDEDGVSADDNIGYFTFNPIEHQKKNTIELSSPDGQLKVALGLNWKYEDR